MYKEITESAVEDVRHQNNIVEVVEEYVHLKKQGRNYFGLCPFHDEKSPSFSVNDEKQIFHCFGCGKGGNVITFMMEMEAFPFQEAVRFLADRAGISIALPDNSAPALSEESTTILSSHEWLTKYYHHLLKYADNGKKGLTYLKDRGITEATIDEFQLGFAPDESELTVQFLKNKGFHTQSLVKIGLLSTSDNTAFRDVFRGRVIFPIKNHLGRPVAFGGRAFQEEEPKYLNSPEHELFHKGNLLYHFHTAKNHIRKQNQAIIFEGYMDVIAAHQAGIKNGVATLGTSLTPQQAKLLKRYVDSAVICYDGDDAGIQASFEAANILHQQGCNVKIAQVKDQLDPDDYIQLYGGKQFVEQVIDLSDSYFSFYMQYKKRQYNLQTDDERVRYIEDIVKQLAVTIKSPIELEYYVNEIADEFNLSTDIIYHDMEKYQQKQKPNPSYQANSQPTVPYNQLTNKQMYAAFEKAERILLAYMLKYPSILEKVQRELGIQFNVEAHKIILTYLYALYEDSQEINISKLMDKLTEEHLRTIVAELSITEMNEDITDEELQDYIQVIRQENAEVASIETLKRKQKKETNPILAAQIGLEIIELRKKLKQRN